LKPNALKNGYAVLLRELVKNVCGVELAFKNRSQHNNTGDKKII